jgi:hypothetical protein
MGEYRLRQEIIKPSSESAKLEVAVEGKRWPLYSNKILSELLCDRLVDESRSGSIPQ